MATSANHERRNDVTCYHGFKSGEIVVHHGSPDAGVERLTQAEGQL